MLSATVSSQTLNEVVRIIVYRRRPRWRRERQDESSHVSHRNAFLSVCCAVVSAAIPCNEEVPIAVSIAGLTLYPAVGCCTKQKNLGMER